MRRLPPVLKDPRSTKLRNLALPRSIRASSVKAWSSIRTSTASGCAEPMRSSSVTRTGRARTLAGQIMARVYQDAPHHLRATPKKCPFCARATTEAVPSAAGTLHGQAPWKRAYDPDVRVAGRRSALLCRFLIDERQHSVTRRDVTFAPRLKQSADLAGIVDGLTFLTCGLHHRTEAYKR